MLGVGRSGPLGGSPVAAGGTQASHDRDGALASRSRDAAPRAPVEPSAGRRATPSGALSERDAWIVLASVEGIGPVTFGALLRAVGSARGIMAAAGGRAGARRIAAAAAAEGLRVSPELAAAIVAGRDDAAALLARLGVLGVRAVTADEDAYPARLRGIELPPPVLFVRGRLEALAADRAVAIVGTRRPTDDGRRAASRIAAALAATGATVVSGLAVGIDGSAHAGALVAGGTTVAVLGSGHARLYPAAHAELAGEIERSGGAVIGELPRTPSRGPPGFRGATGSSPGWPTRRSSSRRASGAEPSSRPAGPSSRGARSSPAPGPSTGPSRWAATGSSGTTRARSGSWPGSTS